jgi:hypothetical protein
LRGKLELNCRPSASKSMQCCMPAYGRKKAAGQGCRARRPAKVNAMVQYAESMVKLDNNAVFSILSNV